MSILEALLLGILQGITEFLPISSDGHLELGKVLLGIKNAEDTTFTVVVHGGTTLSVLFVFWKDVWTLALSPFRPLKGPTFQYLLLILLAAVPVAIVGLTARDFVDSLFNGNMILTGSCLLATAGLLFFAARAKEGTREPNALDAILIGIAQALAVLPGLSRSGMTISTALIRGIGREQAARFSFLIVIIPIMGVLFLDGLKLATGKEPLTSISWQALAVGFVSSFLVGLLACRMLLRIVKRGGLMPFAIYCTLVGLTALGYGLFYS